MDFKKNYYSILGVSPTAAKSEIKSAYRNLARKYHPDKNPGDPLADEHFKEINLANEVLSNDISRAIYDQYKAKEDQLKAGRPRSNDPNPSQGKTKTYTKTTVVKKENRIYIRGEVTIKYWAEQETSLMPFSTWSIDYRINPVEVGVKILDSDIFDYPGTPLNFQKAFTAAELFKVPLSQPVKCTISTAGEEEFYELTLEDVRIKDPMIIDVMKHEGQSLATLKGELYAYTVMMTSTTVTEEVTDIYGETGFVESKTIGQETFLRKEYFYPDGTRYWGPWETSSVRKSQRNDAPKVAPSRRPIGIENAGCAGYWWILPVIIFGLIFPHATIAIIIISVVIWAFSLFANILGDLRAFFIGICAIFFAFLFYDVFKWNRMGRITMAFPKSTNDSVISQENVVYGDQSRPGDKLISHYIRWKDYDSLPHSITLSMLRSDVNSSISVHKNISLIPDISLAPVYVTLLESDERKMDKVYKAFDTLKREKNMDETAFANAVVSCIQSLPYFLVVEKSCKSDNYQDSFIKQFLSQCSQECCVGNAKFGVRSPVEFISDLRGDCDSRALLIYAILKKFDYNVALLTSTYYQHAMIAVALKGMHPASSVSLRIRGKNYLLWETTQPGLKSGEISGYYQDLDQWSVDLLHEKTNS